MKPRSCAEQSLQPQGSEALVMATEIDQDDELAFGAMIERQRVLFVDDEPQVLEGVKDVLRKETFEVVTAASVSEGAQHSVHRARGCRGVG